MMHDPTDPPDSDAPPLTDHDTPTDTDPFDELDHLRALRAARQGTLTADQAAADQLPLEYADLGAILRGDLTPTPSVYAPGGTAPLIYPGCSHDLHGEPSSGKTWVAYWAALDILTHPTHPGGIMVVDWEDNATTFVGRMLALGADPAILGDPTAIAYVNPTGPQNADARDHLLSTARAIDARLVIFDALAPALALDGLNENSNMDAAVWWARMVTPFVRQGHATLAIDHVSRDPATRTRGGRGAGAKLGAITGASYEVLTVRAFSRTTPGELKIKIAKDRHGHVGPYGTIVAHAHINPLDAGALHIHLTPPPATGPGGQFHPTTLMERISRYLEQLDHRDPVTRSSIVGDVTGKTESKRTALDRLVELGHLGVGVGSRNAVTYTLVDPYRAPAEDPYGASEGDLTRDPYPDPAPTPTPPRDGTGQQLPSRAATATPTPTPPRPRPPSGDIYPQSRAAGNVDPYPPAEQSGVGVRVECDPTPPLNGPTTTTVPPTLDLDQNPTTHTPDEDPDPDPW